MNSVSVLRSALTSAGDRLAAQPQKRRWIVGGAILFGSALTSTVIFATAPSAAPEVPKEKAWPVSVLTVAPAALSPMFDAFGKVEATRVARIQTDLVADIATVAVREGQWVTKGDVLVALDPAAFEFAAREREAELARERAVLTRVQTQWNLTKESTGYFQSKRDTAQAKLRRYQGLFEKGMVAQSLLDEVTDQASAAAIEYQTHRLALADFPNQIAEQKARVEQALSALGRAQLDLEHATLHAPFSGPVLSVAASPGNHTALGQPLVEIADAEGLEVRAPVPDIYSAAVRKHLGNGVAITARTGADEGGVTFVLARLAGNVREGHSGIDSFFRVAAPTKTALEIGRV
jgi:multidrug resistance efflux pump